MKAGDRIICVDNLWHGPMDPARKLIKGRIYITNTTPEGAAPRISVWELNGGFVGEFRADRFKLEKEEKDTQEKPFPEGASITCIDNSWNKEWGGQADYAKVTLTEGTEYICVSYDTDGYGALLVQVKDDNGRLMGFFPARFKLTEKKETVPPLTAGMIPFDIDKFEAGVPVITRDGFRVTQLTRFILNEEELYPLVGVVDGKLRLTWTILGKHNENSDSHRDLYHPVPKYYLTIYDKGRVVTVNKGDGKYEPCELPEGEYEVIPIPR